VRSFAAAAMIATALVASPERADAAKQKASKAPESELGLGNAQFVNGDFRGALQHFNSALGEAHAREETAQIHLLRAQCFVALADEPDARRAFELALQQDTEAHLDPSNVPPEMVALLAEVRRSLHAELTLLGQGGAVTLDGAALGPLPIHQQIPIGRHALEVYSGERKLEQKQEIVARPGDSIALTFGTLGPQAAAPPVPLVATAPPAAPPTAPPPSTVTAAPPAPQGETGISPFGHIGTVVDPIDRSLGFEAGAGLEWSAFMGSLSGVWGAAPGLIARAGVASSRLVGPVGGFACAELPIFFASGADVGLGAEAGLSWRFGIVEPYAGVSLQHFFSVPGSKTPSTYFVFPIGARVYLP
jgi:hypothetical protein